MGNYRHDLIMAGDGNDRVSIPAGYSFLSIINNTDNIIYVYQEARAKNDPLYALVKVPQYQSITIPINTTRRDFTFFWLDGGGGGTKKAEFIFSEVNLQINSTLGNSVSGQIVLIGDGVGLAKAAQLPAALGSAGGLKAERVDVGKTTGKATAAGDTTIKNAAGKVWAVVCITAGVTAKLKDGAAERWAVNSATPGNFPVPINCATSIIVNLSGAGEAWVLYE